MSRFYGIILAIATPIITANAIITGVTIAITTSVINMHNILAHALCIFTLLLSFKSLNGNEILPENNSSIEEEVTFQPPKGWKMAELKTFSPNVKAVVVGPGTNQFPPSINLTTEVYTGNLKEYLAIAKSIGEKKGGTWKDLGDFTAKAGKGRLVQLDSKNQWGDLRMMHFILLKNDTIYILTAAALKSDFASNYKEFFNTFSSFQIAFKQ